MNVWKQMRTIAVVLTLGLLFAFPALAAGESHEHSDGEWTSVFEIPVLGDNVPDGGEPGASGTFWLWINSDTETVYYEIELWGVTPPYDSPALTATHIHDGPPGEMGPPRVIFDDPVPQDDGSLWSSGTVQGPFVTGVEDDDGNDQGDGFSLSQIEANPGAYYVDTHTVDYPMGAARGQFGEPTPMMPATGAGGTAASDSSMLSSAAIGIGAACALILIGGFGWVRFRATGTS